MYSKIVNEYELLCLFTIHTKNVTLMQIKVSFSTSEAMNGQPRRDVNIFSNLLEEIDNISHRLYKPRNSMNL